MAGEKTWFACWPLIKLLSLLQRDSDHMSGAASLMNAAAATTLGSFTKMLLSPTLHSEVRYLPFDLQGLPVTDVLMLLIPYD